MVAFPQTFSLMIFVGALHALPTDFKRVSFVTKKDKRSLDYVLDPFDIEYKPLDFSPTFPLSFHESIQFWNTLENGPQFHKFNAAEPLPVEIKNGHISPDFSNGLEYPDPLLLVGLEAKRAASILYSKELFYQDIPHARAILYNQQERKHNGLPENKLGSLNGNSPFARKEHFGGF